MRLGPWSYSHEVSRVRVTEPRVTRVRVSERHGPILMRSPESGRSSCPRRKFLGIEPGPEVCVAGAGAHALRRVVCPTLTIAPPATRPRARCLEYATARAARPGNAVARCVSVTLRTWHRPGPAGSCARRGRGDGDAELPQGRKAAPLLSSTPVPASEGWVCPMNCHGLSCVYLS